MGRPAVCMCKASSFLPVGEGGEVKAGWTRPTEWWVAGKIKDEEKKRLKCSWREGRKDLGAA